MLPATANDGTEDSSPEDVVDIEDSDPEARRPDSNRIVILGRPGNTPLGRPLGPLQTRVTLPVSSWRPTFYRLQDWHMYVSNQYPPHLRRLYFRVYHTTPLCPMVQQPYSHNAGRLPDHYNQAPLFRVHTQLDAHFQVLVCVCPFCNRRQQRAQNGGSRRLWAFRFRSFQLPPWTLANPGAPGFSTELDYNHILVLRVLDYICRRPPPGYGPPLYNQHQERDPWAILPRVRATGRRDYIGLYLYHQTPDLLTFDVGNPVLYLPYRLIGPRNPRTTPL